jgi:hypothetical protein
MKRATLGILVIAGLVVAAIGYCGQRDEFLAPRAPAPPAAVQGSELIALPTPLGDKAQMLTVVDPRQRTMAVYHVDLVSGKITLRSVRNIHWDLQMSEFNSDHPSPREIRLQLEQR